MLQSIYNRSKTENITGNEALEKSGFKKKDLADAMNNGDRIAATLLLFGLVCNKRKYWVEDFEDEDTGDIIPVERSVETDEPLFQSEPGEIERVECFVASIVKDLSDEDLRMLYELFCHKDYTFSRERIPSPIVSELAMRGDADALEWLGDYYGGRFSDDNTFAIDKDKALLYFNKALDAGLSKDMYDIDIKCVERGVQRNCYFGWVYDDRAFNDLLSYRHDFPEEEFSAVDYYQKTLDNYWLSLFPSPMWKSMDDSVPVHCTLKELVENLISEGIPESAFHDYKQGVLVDLKNLSFYLVTGPEEERLAPDGELAVGPHYRKIDPNQNSHFLMDEETFPAESFVECMLDLDRKYPEIMLAIDLVIDKLVGEKEDRGKRLPEVISALQDIFGEDYSNKINSVDYYYSYGPHLSRSGFEYLDYRFYKEMVRIKFKSEDYYYNDHDLNLSYDDFMNLPKDFFVWYSDNPDIWDLEIIPDYNKEDQDKYYIITYYLNGHAEFRALLSDLTYDMLEQKKGTIK